ncbi:MAG: sulfurtransferase-like selenium metabolism protein YedF [Firmicutes bacterium]|nr:sulfurtransferase-like selenium metabolism protein YedF [Bacillota bacterium]
MITVDARGQACPIPVIMTKKEIDQGAKEITVLVDNPTAVENVTKMGKSQGFAVECAAEGADFKLTLTGGDAPAAAPAEEAACECGCDCDCGGVNDWAVFGGRNVIGSGAEELGESLAKMFFYTLAEGDDLPKYVLLMNGGVKLACGDNPTIEHLTNLVAKGVTVLVCGTCLNYYGLSEELKVGTVSNMYDIVSAMQSVKKVFTI